MAKEIEFLQAVTTGNLATVTKLLESKLVDVNYIPNSEEEKKYDLRRPAIAIAILQGNVPMARLLLANNAAVNITCPFSGYRYLSSGFLFQNKDYPNLQLIALMLSYNYSLTMDKGGLLSMCLDPKNSYDQVVRLFLGASVIRNDLTVIETLCKNGRPLNAAMVCDYLRYIPHKTFVSFEIDQIDEAVNYCQRRSFLTEAEGNQIKNLFSGYRDNPSLADKKSMEPIPKTDKERFFAPVAEVAHLTKMNPVDLEKRVEELHAKVDLILQHLDIKYNNSKTTG